MGKFIDLTGKKFGRLLAIERLKNNNKNNAVWLCKCDCGITKPVVGYLLTSGQSTSCGCYQRSGLHKTHGQSHTHLHNTWTNMKTRCYNSNRQQYKDYGGRGIAMCNEWKDNFEAFWEWSLSNGYNSNLSLDRINNDGNYEPGNCRWATRETQARNTRMLRSTNTSGANGVSWDKNKKKWIAYIRANGKHKHLGTFTTIEQAIGARQTAELEYWEKPL